jgi:hypothetical protein
LEKAHLLQVISFPKFLEEGQLGLALIVLGKMV